MATLDRLPKVTSWQHVDSGQPATCSTRERTREIRTPAALSGFPSALLRSCFSALSPFRPRIVLLPRTTQHVALDMLRAARCCPSPTRSRPGTISRRSCLVLSVLVRGSQRLVRRARVSNLESPFGLPLQHPRRYKFQLAISTASWRCFFVNLRFMWLIRTRRSGPLVRDSRMLRIRQVACAPP